MIHALIAGSLYRKPETRTSRGGKLFVTAALKHIVADAPAFVRITAFDDKARGDLAALNAGDAVSVAGRLEAEVYTPEGGEPRVSLSIIADRVSALRRESRQ